MASVRENNGKRKADAFEADAFENAQVVKLTGSEEYGPPAKASRVEQPTSAEGGISGERFGESITYLPLAPEEDDAEAEDLIQGSQEDSVPTDYIHYGSLNILSLLGLLSFDTCC